MSDLYVILHKQGYAFAADGCDYVVIGPMGGEVFRDMAKYKVYAKFLELVRDAEFEARLSALETRVRESSDDEGDLN